MVCSTGVMAWTCGRIHVGQQAGLEALDSLAYRMAISIEIHGDTSRLERSVGIWSKITTDDCATVLVGNQLGRLRAGSAGGADGRVGNRLPGQCVGVDDDEIGCASEARIGIGIEIR